MGRRTGCYSTLPSTLTLREVAVSLILAEGTRSGANAAASPPLAVLGGVILRAAVREFSRLGYLLARKGGPQITVAKRPAELLQKTAPGGYLRSCHGGVAKEIICDGVGLMAQQATAVAYVARCLVNSMQSTVVRRQVDYSW